MKILHITQNNKYKNFFESICKKFSYNYFYIEHEIENININKKCNMTYEDVFYYWKKYYVYFYTFDIILLDNSLMSKIFLMNNFSKKIIIYVTIDFVNNYFNDYVCDLLNSENAKTKIKILFDNEYTNYYFNEIQNIKIYSQIIKPVVEYNHIISPDVLENINKIYVFCENNSKFDIKTKLKNYNITILEKNENIKGKIIYIPTEWTNIDFFKLIQTGIIYFIPTKIFLETLIGENSYLFKEYNFDYLQLSVWYNEKNSEIFEYFNSWEDLNTKLLNVNMDEKIKKNKEYITKILDKNFNKFKDLFSCSDFKLYYINLKKRNDRNEKMLENLKYFEKYNINYERIEAIDGDLIEKNEFKYLFGNEYFKNKKLSNGQVGCILSHIKTIKKFYKSLNKYGIIFEDDIIINTDYSDVVLKKVFEYLENNEFDICFLGMNSLGGSKIYTGEEINNELYKLKYFGFGAHSYILSKNGASKILNYYDIVKIIEPFDYFYKIVKRYKKIFGNEIQIICVKPDFIYYNKMNIENYKVGKEYLTYQKDINDSNTR